MAKSKMRAGTLSLLFQVQYTIKVQMLEIYNETLRDLLSPDQSRENRLDILSTQSSGSNVPGATQVGRWTRVGCVSVFSFRFDSFVRLSFDL